MRKPVHFAEGRRKSTICSPFEYFGKPAGAGIIMRPVSATGRGFKRPNCRNVYVPSILPRIGSVTSSATSVYGRPFSSIPSVTDWTVPTTMSVDWLRSATMFVSLPDRVIALAPPMAATRTAARPANFLVIRSPPEVPRENAPVASADGLRRGGGAFHRGIPPGFRRSTRGWGRSDPREGAFGRGTGFTPMARGAPSSNTPGPEDDGGFRGRHARSARRRQRELSRLDEALHP